MQKLVESVGRVTIGMALGFLFTGCMLEPTSEMSDDERAGRLVLEIATTRTPANVAVVADLARMTVLMTSGRDTLADTITAQGSQTSEEPAWLNGFGGNAHLFVRYQLKSGRRWTVQVKTFDARDSLVHEERCEVDGLSPFEYRSLRVEMSPRRMVYGVGAALPATDATGHAVSFSRAELLVDGAMVRDTLFASPLSASAVPVALTLAYQDMRPGLREVELRAYGAKAGEQTHLLLSGRTVLDVGLARAAAGDEVAPLEWADGSGSPGEGQGEDFRANEDSGFRIGAVGTVVMNVVMSGAVMP